MDLKTFTRRNSIPGSAIGFTSMDDVHQFNLRQYRRKGFNFSVGIGVNNIPIVLSGTAKMLCGLAIFDETGSPGNIYSLVVNNDSRIEDVSSFHLSRVIGTVATALTNGLVKDEYYPVYCPLAGNDSIALNISADAAGRQFVVFYYV